MDDYENGDELYSQSNVVLKKANATHISEINSIGVLNLMKCRNSSKHFLEWKTSKQCEITDTDCHENGWSLVDTIDRTSPIDFSVNTETVSPKSTVSSQTHSKQNVLRTKFEDLKCIEIHGCLELRLMSKDNIKSSSYKFQNNSVHSFINNLERGKLVRCLGGNKYAVVLIQDTDHDKLQKSFSELNIEDIRSSKHPNRLWNNSYTEILSKFANVPQALVSRREVSRPRAISENFDDVGAMLLLLDESQERVLSPRPEVVREPPLTPAQWNESKSEDGFIMEPDRIKEIIFRGGIEPSIRPEVWKYLLNFDRWEHTTKQREEARGLKTQEYFQMKLQWLTFSNTQENNFTGYRDRKCQIEKDVKRTDRAYEFFAGDNNPNLSKLQDILMTYIMYNFDLGYVQGMSDLLAPILSLVENETETFWCFVGFMDKVFTNFDIDQKGMKLQLENLRNLLAFSNETLYNYFKENQSENMYFCFRWLLVWFKREFTNSDILNLWEVLWTGLPCINFHLFICVAILDEEMQIFIDESYTFNEILKHVNELSGKIDLKKILEKAESIYLQVKNSRHITSEIKKIIREDVAENSDEDDVVESSNVELMDKTAEEREILQKKLDEACDMSLSYMFF